MAGPRRMLVNADDFGETEPTTLGILDCAAVGSVRGTSVIVTTPAWDHARSLLRQHTELDYGIHFNLTSGRPVAAAMHLAPLLEADGRFALPGPTLQRLARHPGCLPAVEEELAAQTQRLADSGVTLTHANFNDHLFFWPPLWRIAQRVSAAFRIPYLRRPYQPTTLHRPFSGQDCKRRFLNTWFRRRARQAGSMPVNSFDSFGRANLAAAYATIVATWPGLGELVVHPGRVDPSVDDDFQRAREIEYAFLSTDALPRLAADAGVQLIGYRDL